MERVPIDRLRNVALIAHSGAGKTQLAEAMLFAAGAVKRLGKVDEGSTVMDFAPEEIDRNISINTSLAPLNWQNHKINLIDTPGYFDFIGEVRGGLRVADAAVIVCDAVGGVEVGTEMVWAYAGHLPRLVFISKMDRENADPDKVVAQLRQAFGRTVTPLQYPIGAGRDFQGVIDLVREQACFFQNGQTRTEPVPAELRGPVAALREELVENIAETDDRLLEMYLEEGTVPPHELSRGLRAAVLAGELVPVLCGSGLTATAIEPLLDCMAAFLPAPSEMEAEPAEGHAGADAQPEVGDDFRGYVFKTLADPYVGKISLFKVASGRVRSDSRVYNVNKGSAERLGQLFSLRGREQQPLAEARAGDIVGVAKLQFTTTGDTLAAADTADLFEPLDLPDPVYAVAVEPRSKGDEDKIGTGLQRLAEEDPTFRMERNLETRQTLLYGMGELQIGIITARLKRKFGVEVDLALPRVPFRETVRSESQAEFKYKKQSGGRGQYGHVFLRIHPLTRGAGFQFEEEIFGGAVPRQYIPAVEKGIREALESGALAGYPVTDLRVVLYDGSYHDVDSSEMAFKVAAAQAFKRGFMDADPVLLEPVAEIEVSIPDVFMGEIIGDLNKRRGRVLGMDPQGSLQRVRAQVPLTEIFTYAVDLRSMTQGRGMYTVRPSHYQELPDEIAHRVIGQSRPAAG